MTTTKERSPAQRERQARQHRDHGRYAAVNPCYVCGRSAGVDYYSHHDTDRTINDELLCLCRRCARATEKMDGPTAVAWATRTHPETFQFAPAARA